MRLFHSLHYTKVLKQTLTTLKLENIPKTKPTTPISYFGQRELITPDLFRLLGNKKYNRLYDPFSGSGSISFSAMKEGIAKEYFINDSYPTFKELWELIASDPEKIIISYKNLVKQYLALPFEQRNKFYLNLLKDFNRRIPHDQKESAIHFVFIMNFSEKSIPIFDKNRSLTTEPNVLINKDLEEKRLINFKEVVLGLCDLFKSNKVNFCSGDFSETIRSASHKDLVIFDPPYPEQDEKIYFNLKSESMLQQHLKSAFEELNKRNVDFCVLYGAGPIKKRNQFKGEELAVKHLVRLSHHSFFGYFLEHIYVSRNIHLIPHQLPLSMAFYKDLFDSETEIPVTDYEHAIDLLKRKVENPNEVRLAI